jgi:hypothetical protein
MVEWTKVDTQTQKTAPLSEDSPSESTAEISGERERPMAVTAVAAYQWLKAALFAQLFWNIWSPSHASAASAVNLSSGAGQNHAVFLLLAWQTLSPSRFLRIARRIERSMPRMRRRYFGGSLGGCDEVLANGLGDKAAHDPHRFALSALFRDYGGRSVISSSVNRLALAGLFGQRSHLPVYRQESQHNAPSIPLARS